MWYLCLQGDVWVQMDAEAVGRKGMCQLRVGWGNFDQSELWKGEERIGLSLRIVEVGRYKDWPCKGSSGRCANGQV
jgi:hypothetical protein